MESRRELAMRLDHLRSEISFMRLQVSRQRKEILQLQRAGIPTASAEALLQRMLDKIDGLCAERDRLKNYRNRRAGSWEDGSGEVLPRRSQSATLHQGVGRSPPLSNTGRVVLPARPSDHGCDRPVR
jgi:hypothetical protein